jgi:hypothetical protein
MEAATAAPADVKRWNWGAFLLTWIWGIGNQVWIALLALVPIVGFVMMFVLGVKGNEWAWKKRRWDSVESFHRTQRKWAIAGLILWGVGIVLYIVAIAAGGGDGGGGGGGGLGY